MKFSMLSAAVMMIAACAFGQSDIHKPDVTVAKMTDAEYKRLDDASTAMQKAAETYRKAADDYKKAKDDILGKYNALESSNCAIEKIVDVRGQFIIVEKRQTDYASGGIFMGFSCGYIATPFFVNPVGTLSRSITN
jgi:hypothetical protein